MARRPGWPWWALVVGAALAVGRAHAMGEKPFLALNPERCSNIIPVTPDEPLMERCVRPRRMATHGTPLLLDAVRVNNAAFSASHTLL